MYGASWRVPDPTYVWNTPKEIRERLDAWFRGSRVNRNHWDRRYSNFADRGPARRRPYQLTRMVHRREAEGTTVLDVGCGRGQDVVWLANKGHRAIGVDYAGLGFSKLARVADEQGLDADFWQLNLLELRHVVTLGARLAVEPGPRAVIARHYVDATNKRGREGLFRLPRWRCTTAAGSTCSSSPATRRAPVTTRGWTTSCSRTSAPTSWPPRRPRSAGG